MFGSKILGASALFAFIQSSFAVVAPGFPVSAPSTLNVTYGVNNVSPPGELIPRAETANAPSITSPVPLTSSKGIVFLIDIDVPSNGTRITLLHWLAPNVTLTSNGTLIIPTPGVAPYLQPSPPVGDIPHDYTFLLFNQPANFSIPSQFSSINPPVSDTARMKFDIQAFIKAAGLESPIAGNWISVQNLTGVTATATTFPPAVATASSTGNATSSVMPFTGGAGVMMHGRMFYVGGVVGAAMVGAAAFLL